MITNAIWYAGNECIGIVQVVQEHLKEEYRQTGDTDYKYYIGVGKGNNENDDAWHIADYGLPFDKYAGDALFGVIR